MNRARQPGMVFGLLIILFISVLAVRGMASGRQASEQPELTTEERAWLDQNSGRMVLLYNTEFPPIEFASPAGDFIGLGADVVALVEKQLGVIFPRYPSDDWNQHLADLAAGDCAIAPTIVATPERESFAFFTTPYATVPVVIITRQTVSDTLTLEDLTGGRVAVVSGYATEQYARDRSRGRFEVIPVSSVYEGLRQVSFGHVEAMLENLAVAAYYIDREGIPNLRVAGTTDYAFAWSIGVSRRYPLLFEAIQKALDSIPESDLEAVRRHWISLDVRPGMTHETRRFILLGSIFTVLLLLGLAIISIALKRRLNEKVANLKSAQRKIVEQADRLRLATEAIKAGVWDYYPAGNRRYMSGQWYAMLGYPTVCEEEPETDLNRYIHPEDRVAVDEAFQQYITSDGRGQFEAEFRLRQADGSWRWILSSGRAVDWDENGRVSRIIGLDINIQNIKDVQAGLARSESRFRTLYKMAPIPLATISLDGRILELNDRFVQTLGYTIEKIPTIDHWWRTAYPDPDYRERVREGWGRVVERVMKSAEPVHMGEFRVTDRFGEEHIMIIGANLIENSLLVSLFDITDRKQAEEEREKLREQLLQSQKLEAVGALAGGVAHDFNNMLGAIMGYAQLTLEEIGDDSPWRSNLNGILDAARHSADLTRQLLTFARRQPIVPQLIDLNRSVEAMLNILKRLIGENISLIWQPGTGPCTVQLDPTQLDQVLANLCVNARDAITGAGEIIIETDRVILTESSGECDPGAYVMLTVRDTGCGVDEKDREHIFDPFFTTKTAGLGTGLGLATVYGIVKQNKGLIRIDSQPGRGTTLIIYFPHHASTGETAATTMNDTAPSGRGETILVVEDDPIFLEMSTDMLERLGYSVVAAATPARAIDLVKIRGQEIDLLISDVVMPEMNGPELTACLLEIRPDLKFMFMSGYTADFSHHNFIQKPFTLNTLATKIRVILGSDLPNNLKML